MMKGDGGAKCEREEGDKIRKAVVLVMNLKRSDV